MKNDKWQFVIRTSDFYLSLVICHLREILSRLPGIFALVVRICVHRWFHFVQFYADENSFPAADCQAGTLSSSSNSGCIIRAATSRASSRVCPCLHAEKP